MNLTREQILAMPAGRELDELVAERVMGWKAGAGLDTYTSMWLDSDGTFRAWKETLGGIRPDEFWSPSTDIACAWLVVEKMRLEGSMPELTSGEPNDDWGCWTCLTSAFADTAQLAICRVALLSTL